MRPARMRCVGRRYGLSFRRILSRSLGRGGLNGLLLMGLQGLNAGSLLRLALRAELSRLLLMRL